MADTAPKKLICVVGATGNQGGSVARRFLQDPTYKVRGLTRNPSSEAALELAALGAEMVVAELDDVNTLIPAFAGANVIFSVTQYWEPFFRPDCRAKARELGVSCRRYAYDVEYLHGMNITDAAATTVDTLDENGFLVSTLSHAANCSNGKFKELYHFDSKADIFPDYVNEKFPKLAAKMSCIHTGFFFTSYRILPTAYFHKESNGSYTMQFTTDPTAPIPQLDVNADTGNFTYAVSKMSPGKAYICAGSFLSFGDYMKLWGETLGIETNYKRITFDELVATTPDDKDLGIEVAHMFDYSSDPGYMGGMVLITPEDLRKAGIDCPMTSAKQFIEKNDWSAVLGK